jgi:hypothetical protein
MTPSIPVVASCSTSSMGLMIGGMLFVGEVCAQLYRWGMVVTTTVGWGGCCIPSVYAFGWHCWFELCLLPGVEQCCAISAAQQALCELQHMCTIACVTPSALLVQPSQQMTSFTVRATQYAGITAADAVHVLKQQSVTVAPTAGTVITYSP